MIVHPLRLVLLAACAMLAVLALAAAVHGVPVPAAPPPLPAAPLPAVGLLGSVDWVSLTLQLVFTALTFLLGGKAGQRRPPPQAAPLN